MTKISNHVAIVGSERTPLPGAKALGRANPNEMIEVTLKLRAKQELPPLTERPTTTMTREQIGDMYGSSQDDIDKVVETLGKFDLKPVNINAATQTVRLRGTITAMEKAFQVRLFHYTHETERYRGRVGHAYVPADLKDIVVAVLGLDNRRIVRRRKRADKSTTLASSSPIGYLPSELASHYNFPEGDGEGQTIGLLEFGGGYFEDDLRQFCQEANISSIPEVKTISVDGTHTNSRDGQEGEVMLDIEVIAGICPKAKIVVYFAEFGDQGFTAALDRVFLDQENDPGVVSISWGLAEGQLWAPGQGWTPQAINNVNNTLNKIAHANVTTVCVSAGDDGSSDALLDGHAHIDFPGSSPYILSVGGTTIPNNGGTQPDIVWYEIDGLRSSGGGSTGGGVSTVPYSNTETRPPWQNNITITSVNPGAIAGRVIPDLAANADWTASPYLIVVDGQPQPNGGTSASSPLIAGLLTLINAKRPADKRVGYLTPVLYQTIGANNVTVGSAGCMDVTSGNNDTAQIGGYSAGPGYDAVSGWGTPDGKKLAQAIAQAIDSHE